jgi:hypothetical protein
VSLVEDNEKRRLKGALFRVFAMFREYTTSQWLLVRSRDRLAQAEHVEKQLVDPDIAGG